MDFAAPLKASIGSNLYLVFKKFYEKKHKTLSYLFLTLYIADMRDIIWHFYAECFRKSWQLAQS